MNDPTPWEDIPRHHIHECSACGNIDTEITYLRGFRVPMDIDPTQNGEME